MATRSLKSAILNEQVPSINFFNGRLLTGEDLSTEQMANREGRRRLGQAIGEGIVSGLEVSESAEGSTKAPPTVTVKSGVAINRLGQTIVLANDEDLLLVQPTEGNPAESTPVEFAPCKPTETGVYVAGEGIYLLTIAPAFGSVGRAQVSGLGNTEARCNRKYILEGAEFRLIQLDFKRDLKLTDDELNSPDRLRNLVAYKFFGVEDPATQSFLSNPFGPQVETYGVLDDLRPNRLTDCEVPLAIIYWTAKDGITFIDMWAVRRRLTKPSVSDSWNFVVGDRRRSEAEAMFLQFQAQIEELRTGLSAPETAGATNHFRYLPAVAILPLTGSTGVKGFDYKTFFGEKSYRDAVHIEGARVQALFQDSFAYPPIDLQSKEMVWLYFVRENRQAIDVNVTNKPRPYVIFASGHMPFYGEARYDVNRWDYSNYV